MPADAWRLYGCTLSGPKSFTAVYCKLQIRVQISIFHRVLQARNEVLEELPFARQALIRARVSDY